MGATPTMRRRGQGAGVATAAAAAAATAAVTARCSRARRHHQCLCGGCHGMLFAATALLLVLTASPCSAQAASSTCGVKAVCPAPATPAAGKGASQPPRAGSGAPAAAPAPAPAAAAAAAAAAPSSPRPLRLREISAAALLADLGARNERLHVPQQLAHYIEQQGGGAAAAADDMPQRVAPARQQAALSATAQREVFTNLLGVLLDGGGSSDSNGSSSNNGSNGSNGSSNSNNSNGTNGSSGSSGSSGSAGNTLPPAKQQPVRKAPASSAVLSSGAVQVQQEQQGAEPGMVYLRNARLRVGMDTTRGGAISHVSSPVMPPEWAGRNLINTFDSGRLIQQSYYGCYDGSCWTHRPWRWNPVQGGSWQNRPPRLLNSSVGAASFTTASLPRNWAGQELLEDVVMVTRTQLLDNLVKISFTMRYSGDAQHPEQHQELPAVFVDRRLNVLAMYTGAAPWSDGPLTFVMPGQVGEYYVPTEGWAAYVDQSSGFGLGVFSPTSDQLVAYRVGPEGSAARSDTSYFAPLVTAHIQPNTEAAYDVYVAVGRVDEMRAAFAEVAARLAGGGGGAGSERGRRSFITAVPPAPLAAAAAGGGSGRAPDSSRQPARSFIVDAGKKQGSRVQQQQQPGGKDAVAFAAALPTPASMTVDTRVVQPPPAGVRVGSKPPAAELKPRPFRAAPPVRPPASAHKPGGAARNERAAKPQDSKQRQGGAASSAKPGTAGPSKPAQPQQAHAKAAAAQPKQQQQQQQKPERKQLQKPEQKQKQRPAAPKKQQAPLHQQQQQQQQPEAAARVGEQLAAALTFLRQRARRLLL